MSASCLAVPSSMRHAGRVAWSVVWLAALCGCGGGGRGQQSTRAQALYEADSSNGYICKFTPGGAESTFASGAGSPLGLVFDSSGNLYEADENGGHIFKFTPDGARSTFASGLIYPEGLAFDSSGNLYEGDIGSGHIYKFAPDG